MKSTKTWSQRVVSPDGKTVLITTGSITLDHQMKQIKTVTIVSSGGEYG
jgi:hypothetical protein